MTEPDPQFLYGFIFLTIAVPIDGQYTVLGTVLNS